MELENTSKGPGGVRKQHELGSKIYRIRRSEGVKWSWGAKPKDLGDAREQNGVRE